MPHSVALMSAPVIMCHSDKPKDGLEANLDNGCSGCQDFVKSAISHPIYGIHESVTELVSWVRMLSEDWSL